MKRLLTGARKLTVYRVALVALIATLPLIGAWQLVRSQDPPPAPENKEGKTAAVLIVPGNTVNAGEVIFKADADHDGMSDEDEEANGTDPNDASDADEDSDGDGLTNGDEVANGSGVNNADSDGDGVSDGEEVRLGFNPGDPSNVPPVGVTLTALQVTPNPAQLVINSLLGQQPIQLTVTGVLSNNSTVDLTAATNTSYQSLHPSVAIVDGVGKVAGVSAGIATINVVNGSISAQTTVNVAPFAPRLMSFLQLAAQGNNVDVSGNLAYVAVASAGIQIVDVTDRRAPGIVATLDTSGNANDIRVVGNLAYVADGSAGLKIIDVTNPASPFLRGTIDTSGDAQDVVVYGARAYVADGASGLQIINVSNPAAPAIVRTVDTPGNAYGVDVSGNTAVVADRFPTSGVRVIDITNETAAQMVGTLNMPANVEDIVTRDSLAYCAGSSNGLFIVDFSSPSLPVLRGQHNSNETGHFWPTDIALAGDFVLAAETRLSNAVPIDDISDPADPRYRGSLDYSASGTNYDGTGIAIDPGYVYTTATNGSVSRLYIGQYQAGDTTGIPPTVSVTSPSAGVTLMEGQPIELQATASDDIEVVGVQFKMNGNIAGPLVTSAPYRLNVFVPLDISSLTLTATAFDMGANATVSEPVTVNVIPDPGTTVIGRVVDRLNQPMANATVKAFEGYSTVTGADGLFSFYAPSVLGNTIKVTVAAERNGQPFAGVSPPVPLIVSGVTNMGDVLVKPTGQIAFAKRPPGQFEAEIYLMDAKGENETRLTFNAARVYEPRFSPDGLKIAFNRDDYCGQNVWVMNADGTNQNSISPGEGYVWSPDSRKLAYNFNDSLYISNADGSGKRLVTTLGYFGFYGPTWSPDGTKLAFIGREGTNKYDVYTINADGTNRQKITNTLTTKYEVAWSPDGAWIAYVQHDGTRLEKVFAIHPDGSGSIRISTDDAYYYDLSWMPDSKKVLVVNDPSQGSSLNLLDVNGGAPFRVTNNGTAYDWGPALSEDGVTIAFASDDGLFSINSDGTGQKLLNARGWDPSFRPEVIQEADPGTFVSGRVVDATNQPVPNATLKLFGQTVGTSGADGTFTISGATTLKGNITIIASAASGGGIQSGFSAAVAPVAGGITQVGDVRIAQNIAFISDRDGNSEVYLMDADGSNQRRVTTTEGNESRPSLSPDGTRIAYASDRDGHNEIYVMNLNGSDPVRVSYLHFNCLGDSDPDWSPDGTKILFTGRASVNGSLDIYVVNANGTNQTQLTTHFAQDYMPSWLPDGSRIMFVSFRDNGFGEIYTMNANGSSQTRLTNNSIAEREPTWSPDNTKIAYSNFRNGRDSIFVINVDGSNEVQVTTDAASNDYPVWSRDSLRIFFSSNADVNYQIYVINLDGTNRLRLSNNTFDDIHPDW